MSKFLGRRLASLAAPTLLVLLAGFSACRPGATSDESRFSYRFIVGERIVYRLQYKSTSSYDFRALFGEEISPQSGAPLGLAKTFETSVQGFLSLTAVERNEAGTLFDFGFDDLVLTMIADGAESPKQAEMIKSDLRRDIFASVNAQGRIVSLELDPSMNALSQSYVRAVLAMTQFVFPEGTFPRSGQWQTREGDPAGLYVAGYALNKNEGDRADTFRKTFFKTKIQYLRGQETSGVGPVEVSRLIVPRGILTARFDFSEGFLFSLHGAESQDILVNAIKVGHARDAMDLYFVRKEALDEAGLSSMENEAIARRKIAKPMALDMRPSRDETQAAIERRHLGEATLQSLLAELEGAEAAQDSRYNSTSLFLKFKALIYLRPESCESLGKALSSAASGSKTMQILTMALSAVGHAEAQAALIAAIRAHAQDASALSELLPALGTVEQSTPSAEGVLRELAFDSREPDVAAVAQLSLGAQARRLARGSPERARKIVESFIDKVASSPSPDVTRQLLLALGNAGSALALPTMANYAGSPSPELRAAAIRALRFIDSSRADELLLCAVASDGEGSVRREAAYVLGFRKMGRASYKTQTEVFLKDPDVSVRLGVLRNLWNAHETYPEVKRLVQRAAKKDLSREIEKAAAELLGRDESSRSR
jgi:hypothetical protein